MEEWRVPQGEQSPTSPLGYIISFVLFHERGFTSPSLQFFQGLLQHYGLELQHLNPNGIQHVSTFVAVCEGFLGVPPVFNLFLCIFSIYPIKARVGGELHLAPVRCASIHLRGGGGGKNTWAGEYMSIPLTKDNKGWPSSWFYVKNHGDAPLPAYSS